MDRSRLLVTTAAAAVTLATLVGTPGPERAPGHTERGRVEGRVEGRLDWWREARFGLFVHWGLYAVPAGEWGGRTDYGEWIRDSARIPLDEYDGFRTQFRPTRFDADAWARLARRAGMRYIVITTKHHDGFALFDSRVSDSDVMATPFARDVMKELSQAAAREGLHMGWYYSIMDWHHPDYLPRRPWETTRSAEGADYDRYVAYMKAQLRELLTSYGPVGVMWFDGQWEGTWNNTRGQDLYDYVRFLQPSIIVNNRVGRAGGDFGMDREQGAIGDYGTPEQEVPTKASHGVDWETCLTMNGHWGYNRADKNFKSTTTLIRLLADIASKGGNLLLNVGPTADGEIPPESVERLEAMGRWMDVNGEAIHGTQAGPFPVGALAWGRATQRALDAGRRRLYLHVFDWPADGTLVVDGLLSDPTHAFLLADPQRRPLMVARRGGDALAISVPSARPDEHDAVVVVDVAGRPDVAIAPVISADTPVFIDTIDVHIASDRERVDLRYTTDASDPTAASPTATGPVHLSATATVRARAFRGDHPVSPVASLTFMKVAPRPAVQVAGTTPGLRYRAVEGRFVGGAWGGEAGDRGRRAGAGTVAAPARGPTVSRAAGAFPDRRWVAGRHAAGDRPSRSRHMQKRRGSSPAVS